MIRFWIFICLCYIPLLYSISSFILLADLSIIDENNVKRRKIVGGEFAGKEIAGGEISEERLKE